MIRTHSSIFIYFNASLNLISFFFLCSISLVLYRCKSLCCLLFACGFFCVFTKQLNFYIYIYPLYSIFYINFFSLACDHPRWLVVSENRKIREHFILSNISRLHIRKYKKNCTCMYVIILIKIHLCIFIQLTR